MSKLFLVQRPLLTFKGLYSQHFYAIWGKELALKKISNLLQSDIFIKYIQDELEKNEIKIHTDYKHHFKNY